MTRGERHWRPSLGFVLGGALAATLGLSLAGLVALRYLGPVIGFRAAALGLGLLILAATAALGWLLRRLLLRPIRALEAYAVATERGSAASVAPPRHFGTRELHATARRVIGMAEALRDREATIRSFSDHVTHELKTPVSAIRAAVELLEDGGALSAQDARLARDIDGARRQIETQLAALRQAAQARETRYLGQSRLGEVIETLGPDFPSLRLLSQGPDQTCPLSPQGLTLVLRHLLQNAADHGAQTVTLQPNGAVLDICDDGPGIAAGNAGRIFDPFFTTRRAAGGTGMGLTIVRNLLAAHRATIAHVPTETGTCLRIRFGDAPV